MLLREVAHRVQAPDCALPALAGDQSVTAAEKAAPLQNLRSSGGRRHLRHGELKRALLIVFYRRSEARRVRCVLAACSIAERSGASQVG